MHKDGYLNGFWLLAAILGFCVCTKLLKLSRLALNGFGFSRTKSYRNDQKTLYMLKKQGSMYFGMISPGLHFALVGFITYCVKVITFRVFITSCVNGITSRGEYYILRQCYILRRNNRLLRRKM